jgi:hypothetical protein
MIKEILRTLVSAFLSMSLEAYSIVAWYRKQWSIQDDE